MEQGFLLVVHPLTIKTMFWIEQSFVLAARRLIWIHDMSGAC